MGVALTEILVMKQIEIDELSGRTIVVDTPLWLYQFLSSIRQRDGTLLTDSKGNVTSHLAGLLSRIVNLMEKGIRLAFVFDGEPPKLKRMTLEKRKEIKIEAQKEYERAAEKGDEELMKKYAQRTSRLTPGMIEEARSLIKAIGLPVIDAPTEAEAQAAHIVKSGKAFALATNDADALLFGAPRIVRNLNMVGKKKKSNRLSYETINPEIISLEENLTHLGISQEQLIALAMLVGTDFNMGGIRGIGPKNALKLVKKHGSNFEFLFKEVKWDESFDYPWNEVFDLIKNMKVTDSYSLEWKMPDRGKLIELLVNKHEFSEQRILPQIDRIAGRSQEKSQKGLSHFM